MATAGRHHRAWCLLHAALIPIYWNLAWPVRPPLPINPGVNSSVHRFGGFRLRHRWAASAWQVSKINRSPRWSVAASVAIMVPNLIALMASPVVNGGRHLHSQGVTIAALYPRRESR